MSCLLQNSPLNTFSSTNTCSQTILFIVLSFLKTNLNDLWLISKNINHPRKNNFNTISVQNQTCLSTQSKNKKLCYNGNSNIQAYTSSSRQSLISHIHLKCSYTDTRQKSFPTNTPIFTDTHLFSLIVIHKCLFSLNTCVFSHCYTSVFFPLIHISKKLQSKSTQHTLAVLLFVEIF